MHNNLRATTGILISNIKFIIPGFQKYMSPHTDILSWFRAYNLLFLLNAVCLAEKQQIPI